MDLQESLKNRYGCADDDDVSELAASMRQLIDHVVDRVPGVTGALVSSADGFVLASRMPVAADDASVAAMSSALLGLSDRLLRTVGNDPVRVGQLRSDDAQVFLFAIAHAATLTVFADSSADGRQVVGVGREITLGLTRLFRGTVDV